MIICLDANVVIYLVEQNPVWFPRVTSRLSIAQKAGDEIAVSEAARLECLVGPLISSNATELAEYVRFFSHPDTHMLPVTGAVWERAARIRAVHRFEPMDQVGKHAQGAFDSARAQEWSRHRAGSDSFAALGLLRVANAGAEVVGAKAEGERRRTEFSGFTRVSSHNDEVMRATIMPVLSGFGPRYVGFTRKKNLFDTRMSRLPEE